jgi:hypothetical protein
MEKQMKRILPALAAVGVLALALPAAAQSSTEINRRQAELDARITRGLQDRSLTPAQGAQLRDQFNEVAAFEARYRDSNGLQRNELADLDRRLDFLENRVRIELAANDRSDRRGAPWQAINMRQAMLDRRIDRGLADGSLTRREAIRLRAEFQQIARLEQRYRSTGGLQGWERADLDQRFDRLSAQIRLERADNQERYDRRDGRGVGYNAGVR